MFSVLNRNTMPANCKTLEPFQKILPSPTC
jgi:hypothetical protein